MNEKRIARSAPLTMRIDFQSKSSAFLPYPFSDFMQNVPLLSQKFWRTLSQLFIFSLLPFRLLSLWRSPFTLNVCVYLRFTCLFSHMKCFAFDWNVSFLSFEWKKLLLLLAKKQPDPKQIFSTPKPNSVSTIRNGNAAIDSCISVIISPTNMPWQNVLFAMSLWLPYRWIKIGLQSLVCVVPFACQSVDLFAVAVNCKPKEFGCKRKHEPNQICDCICHNTRRCQPYPVF